MNIIRVGFLSLFFLLLLKINTSNSHCTSRACERVSLSLYTNVKRNFFLVGYVFQNISSLRNWKQCLNVCLKNCQCLSFNFNELNATENCELNDANTKLEPEALREMEGVNYYELARNYYDEKGAFHQTCSEAVCQNKCCDSTLCENGGTCREICDVSQRRYNCACPAGFVGHRCQFLLRTCKDVKMLKNVTVNGVYTILDLDNNSFPVYCSFGPETRFVWTLIQSYALKNNDAFASKAFYLHDMPINQAAPEWRSYRLSMSRMRYIAKSSTHWRATCNFPTAGVDYRDYIFTSLSKVDLLAAPDEAFWCGWYDFVQIRGIHCKNCTAFTIYGEAFEFHIDSWATHPVSCDFNGQDGVVHSEDNFGYSLLVPCPQVGDRAGYYGYEYENPAFRCSSSPESTTQYWFGSR